MPSNRKEPNMFVFAAIICVVCSVVLTAAATGLKSRQEANIKLDKQKNILKAMALMTDGEKLDRASIETLYKTNIKDKFMTPTGELVDTDNDGQNKAIYINEENGSIKRYAIPTAGYGLWSWIYGFLALEGDGNTIAGMSVYQHGETPGLGGECEKPWFVNQFIGKKIVNKSGQFVSVGIAKGKATDKYSGDALDHYVDGMSGATITSQGLDKSLASNLMDYEVFSKTLRK